MWIDMLNPIPTKIIKLKMTTFALWLYNYNSKKMFKNIYYKKYDYETINEFKYILLVHKVVAIHNVTY
jgi:hypothetical protein